MDSLKYNLVSGNLRLYYLVEIYLKQKYFIGGSKAKSPKEVEGSNGKLEIEGREHQIQEMSNFAAAFCPSYCFTCHVII